MAAGDVRHLRRTLNGTDLDAWDPEYIRRVLPLWGTVLRTYFRSEVRGLEHIPDDGPCLLVGNHSGGILIADTFAFAVGFYERFGPHRRFHQLAHDVRRALAGTGISRWGTVAASHENARKAFDAGAPVLVYPGGDYETFRPVLALRPDRVRRPPGLHPARAGRGRADRARRGDRAGRRRRCSSPAASAPAPSHGLGEPDPHQGPARGAIAPPFGATLLDLPARLPLPAKITIEVLPPIDLKERFGPDPTTTPSTPRSRRTCRPRCRTCRPSARCPSWADVTSSGRCPTST
jgi:hypothetical protein